MQNIFDTMDELGLQFDQTTRRLFALQQALEEAKVERDIRYDQGERVLRYSILIDRLRSEIDIEVGKMKKRIDQETNANA